MTFLCVEIGVKQLEKSAITISQVLISKATLMEN